MKDFGERIRQIREEKGLQQEEAARRIGIHKNALYRYEKGMVEPKVSMVPKIARALDVDPGDLFEGTPYPKVLSLPATPLANTPPEEMEERRRSLLGRDDATDAIQDVLDRLREEEKQLEEWAPKNIPRALLRLRVYRVAFLDTWSKLVDPRDVPSKSIMQITQEIGETYDAVRAEVEDKERQRRTEGKAS
jgi:transcriptional regulator with XRE-family HTH domain